MSDVKDITEIYGNMVFNDSTMKQYLPKETYLTLKKCVNEGTPLDSSVANIVANAMKEWAIKKGATHYSHWFQPLTGITAEKHDSFITPLDNGKIVTEFSGKELIKGEPDASSFPSGGLRATFEARGYTAWDPTSYAFVKEDVLCIPCAFYSYSGEVLDEKTPLLRSIECIQTQALRILDLFGTTNAKRVIATVGAEQEYFLIDREMYKMRKDLRYTGRTLFGALPPKGQEMETHYFGNIRPRVRNFMKELDKELWMLGVPAKTEHNEVAPSQHELACVFSDTNIATDQNQITMEMMKKVAERQGLACLLHEKPFEGVNGSGKHNNWSLATDTGINLLEPGNTPSLNAQFLLFLVAVIKAVDEHQDLLRIAIASAGNDLRLGGDEAPPSIISIFLGDELVDILNAIEEGRPYKDREMCEIEIGVDTIPHFPKDTTDRNRTSPFAFTSNKFEFRMLGSGQSVARANTTLNTIVAVTLCEFADELEKAEDFKTTLNKIIRTNIKKHKRILFNGNGYDEKWVKEAENRGLLNLKSSDVAFPYLTHPKNIELFTKMNVFSEAELYSRCELMQENYCKVIHIEALTMIDMVRKDIVPAAYTYLQRLSTTALSLREVSPKAENPALVRIIEEISNLTSELSAQIDSLEDTMAKIDSSGVDMEERTHLYREQVVVGMQLARIMADAVELRIGEKYWPYPTYGDLLFTV